MRFAPPLLLMLVLAAGSAGAASGPAVPSMPDAAPLPRAPAAARRSTAPRSAPAVARHDTVQVHVQAGRVQLLTQGRALSGGAVGDTVRVLNPASRQSFAARVLAAGEVLALDGGTP